MIVVHVNALYMHTTWAQFAFTSSPTGANHSLPPVGPMPPLASSPSKIAPLFNFQEERILAERQRGAGKVAREGGRRLSRAASLERPLSAVRSPTRSDFSSCYDVVRPSVLMIQKAVEHDVRSVGWSSRMMVFVYLTR